MQLYGILRRNGWRDGEALQAAAKKSSEVGDEPGSGVRWIRSYVLSEESGELGTFCVYQRAPGAPSLRAPPSSPPRDPASIA